MAHLDPEPLVRKVKNGGYINKLLQAICGSEGLSKFGVKLELQNRIIDRIRHYAQIGDEVAFNRFRTAIESPHTIGMPATPMYGMAPQAAANSQPPLPSLFGSRGPTVNGTAFNMGGGGAVQGFKPVGHPRVEFRQSPFYTVEAQLGNPQLCDVMAQHRHTVRSTIRTADYGMLSRVEDDPSLKVMVFCAAEGYGLQDIVFPHQSEIKVNGGEVKANLRGLKNKPGSTRPVDITKELRFRPATYSNTVEMTYALTQKKFYLLTYVVKTVPVTDLAKRIEDGKKITANSVVANMVNKARDTEIVQTASVLSLKCPISTMRIDLPCRGTSCRHNQCFDATSYLQMQEQGPTWLCPICNNVTSFETLAVDEYVKDILTKTDRSVEQVTIEPDGKWSANPRKENNHPKLANGVASMSDSDDDIVEISKSGDSLTMATPRSLPSAIGAQSRHSPGGPPRLPSGSTNGNGKRAAAVIDLTSSGDEDDETPASRPAKRQYAGNGDLNSLNPPVYREPPQPNVYGPRS